MQRVTMLGLALVRLRFQWPLALAQGLGMAAATTLAVAIPLVQLTASQAGLERTAAGLGSGRYVTVEEFGVGSKIAYDSFQDATQRRVLHDAGDHLHLVARYQQGPHFTPIQNNGHEWIQDSIPTPALGSREGLADHVRLVQGAWAPDGPGADGAFPVAISADGAKAFAWNVGDVLCNGFTRPLVIVWCVRVAAIWAPISASDPYWGGTVPAYTAMVGEQSWWGIYAKVTAGLTANGRTPPFGTSVAGQVWAPDLESLRAGQITPFADRLNRMRGYFAVQRAGFFTTALDTAIRDFQRRYAVAAFSVQMVAAALLAIAVYSVGFLAAHYLEAQADVLAVMVGRGFSRLRAFGLLAIQFGLLAAAAIPVGLVIAYVVARLLGLALFGGTTPPLHAGDLVQLVPFALAVVAALVMVAGIQSLIAARGASGENRRARARRGERAWWRWRNLDLAGAAVAVAMLFEVQLHGSVAVRAASSDVSGDPLAIALPAVALALLAVASLRLLPLSARIVGGLARGVPGSLARWQLERRAAQYARLAVLVSFAVAVGLFSTVYATTDRANAADRAAYAAGADVRGVFAGANASPPDVDGAVAALPNVAAVDQAYRGLGSPGTINVTATVLGIPGSSFMDEAWSRSGLDGGGSLTDLTARLNREDPDGVVIAGRPTGLSIWTWSSGFAGVLSAVVSDATGQTCRCRFGELDQAGVQTHTARIAFPRPPAYPLKLRALTVSREGQTVATGEVTLGDLAATDASGARTPVEGFDKNIGWWHMYQGPISDINDLYTGVEHRRDGAPTTELFVNLGRGTFVARPKPNDRAIPALISAQTLDKLGLSTGQTFPMHVDTHVILVRAVSAVDYFPTLYPGTEDFLVMPRDTLLGRLGYDRYELAWPNEAWMRVKGDDAPVVEKIKAAPSYLDVSSRRATVKASLQDPLRIALQATLAIGFVAALAMAVLGFGLHFLVAARGRLAEYAVLQANGLPASAIGRSMLAEQAVLLVHSVVVGAALALVMAWSIIPSMQISPNPQDVIPPTVLHFDALGSLGVLALVAAAALAAGGLAVRVAGRFDLVRELRRQ